MQKFKNGDVVELISGGPPMTVEAYGEYSFKKGYLCIWFDGKKRYENVFTEDTLILVDYDNIPSPVLMG